MINLFSSWNVMMNIKCYCKYLHKRDIKTDDEPSKCKRMCLYVVLSAFLYNNIESFVVTGLPSKACQLKNVITIRFVARSVCICLNATNHLSTDKHSEHIHFMAYTVLFYMQNHVT